MNCGTAAPTFSATGNQRQHQGIVVFRERAEEVTVLPPSTGHYLGVVLGGVQGEARGEFLLLT